MKLSHYFKARGATVCFEPSVSRGLFEPEYDAVFGSAIFSTTEKKLAAFRSAFPTAIVGGTGTGSNATVEELLGVDSYEYYDYNIYPDFPHSIGFTQRGCRLRCKFCVVPMKEGKVKEINTLADLWRGPGHPKNILLLDNDFFGQPRWKELCEEAIEGGYKVSFSQGINIRLIHKEGAEYLAKMRYMDDQFKRRRIYTAWDNKRDEEIFFRGIGYLLEAGIKADDIMVYMLCNYWEKGLSDDVWHRFNSMVNIGLRPYPMVYDVLNADQRLRWFQRWVIRRGYLVSTLDEYMREQAKRGKAEQMNTLFES